MALEASFHVLGASSEFDWSLRALAARILLSGRLPCNRVQSVQETYRCLLESLRSHDYLVHLWHRTVVVLEHGTTVRTNLN
jgi:hypothetical protein